MVKHLIIVLGFALISSSAMAQKAGVGAWENSRKTTLEWIERRPSLGWYYNWRADQMWYAERERRSVEFVPMIHSAEDIGRKIISDRRVTTLLGFNEPDGKGSHQARLSPEQAAALWPKLEAYGLRLGSPATTQGQTLGRNSWQRRFMQTAESRGLRVDFMAVHYYSSDGDVDKFRNWLIAVYRTYNRPIWVTEFARIDWRRSQSVTYDQNARFIREAVLMMEKLPFVERYAWFAANPYPWKGRTPRVNLIDDNLRPTPVGLEFDQVLQTIGSRGNS